MAENEPSNLEVKSASEPNLISETYFGTAELTHLKSPLVPETYEAPYNPDDLWKKKGDYSIYEDMVHDDQVSICLQLKKDLVIGSGFEFVSKEEGQEEIIEDLEIAFTEDVEVPFSEMLQEILTAYEFGFSLSEKVFKVREDGKLRLNCLKTRHPNSWLIHQDVKGNVIKYEQNTSEGSINVNPKALIHYVNNRKFQNPYGTSDLRAAYNAWFSKRQVIRYFAIFLEKAASPIPVARYDKNAPKPAVDDIFNALKKFQTKTALAIPKEIELEFLESKSTGEAYKKAIDIFNMFIGRSLFIPDLLGLTGGETDGGSFSLGKEQMKVFFLHINRRKEAIEKLVNDHLVWPTVVYNHGFVENYPKFRFKPLDDERAGELAKTWLEAVKSKVYTPNEEEINHFRTLCKFPEGDVEIPQAQSQYPGYGGGTGDSPAPDESGACPVGYRLDTRTGKCVRTGKPIAEKEDDVSKEEKPDKTEEKKKTNFAKSFDQVSGDYHKKVNFKALETKLNDYDQSVLMEAEPIIRKIFADVYDQIEKKKIVKEQKHDRIDSIKLKYLKELKQVLKSSFAGIYKDGQLSGQQEIFKSNFRSPVATDDFLEMLEAETFRFIGDWEYTITKRVKNQLVAAIKDGESLASVIDVLDDSGKSLAKTSLERFARTKHTEVLNKGRIEFFQSTGVITGYQYSAILDDRTSEICRGLHGKKFKAGSEPIPPMHFNCRSLLIPITKYEEFEASENVGKMPISEFIDEHKGEGFSVK